MKLNDENSPKVRLIPAVNAVIFNDRREVLLTKRSKAVREPGKWCLPGGHFDPGEDWQTALRREVAEEIGLEVLEETLSGIYSDPKLTLTEKELPGGHFGQFITATFIVVSFRGDVVINHESSEWAYFPVKELPTPILKSHPIRIQDAFDFSGRAFVR